MQNLQSQGSDLRYSASWFPKEIQLDPWVVYHGTSSVNETWIDSEGFTPRAHQYAEAARRAVCICRSLNWWGPDHANSGISVLNSFSLNRGALKKGSPVFCTLYPFRTLIYLWQEFAGGESAYALRKFIPYFLEYAGSGNIQESHFEKYKEKVIRDVRKGFLPNYRAVIPNSQWLEKQVSYFTELQKQLIEIELSHEYGVIYALRLIPEDLKGCQYSWSDGLRVRPPVPPGRIIAKHRIIKAEEIDQDDEMAGNENHWKDEGELVQQIKLMNADPSREFEQEPRLSTPELRDLEAGEDVTLDIVVEYGTSEMKEWARKQFLLPIEERYCPVL